MFCKWGLEMSFKKTRGCGLGCVMVPICFNLVRGSVEISCSFALAATWQRILALAWRLRTGLEQRLVLSTSSRCFGRMLMFEESLLPFLNALSQKKIPAGSCTKSSDLGQSRVSTVHDMIQYGS